VCGGEAFLDRDDDFGEEWVGDVGNDQSDGVGLPHPQAGCTAVINVAQPFDGSLNPFAGGIGHRRNIANHQRDSSPGNTGVGRYVKESDTLFWTCMHKGVPLGRNCREGQ
jgi:hypothetical protein